MKADPLRSPLAKMLLALALVATACNSSTTSDSTEAPDPTEQPRASTTQATSTTVGGSERIADLVMHNGQVVTMDDGRTTADGLAIAEGDIIAVGDADLVLAHIGPETVVVDLQGRSVVPGFVDPHTHLLQAPAPDLDAMREAHREMLAGGTTTAGTPSVEPAELEAFTTLDVAGELAVRTHLYVLYNGVCGDRPFDDFYLESSFSHDPESKLVVAGVKIFGDGGVCRAPAVSFGYPHTVPQPLKDSGWVDNGDLYVDAQEVAAVVEEVDALGGQVVIHAIGDRALRAVLAGLDAASEGGLEYSHRIEHNSMVALLEPDELAIYGRAGITPIIQLMPWASACEEGRSELWASILPEPAYSSIEDRRVISAANPGIEFAWHGDNPSIPGAPLQQMFSAVTAGAVDPSDGSVCYPEAWDWFPTIGVVDALALTTINAARAMLIDDRVGSLEVGKVADLLILDQDILHADPEVGLARNRPILTMIGGVIHHCEPEICESFASGGSVPEPPTTSDGWLPVDHAVVTAVRASRSLQPPTLAVDGVADAGWVSGEGPTQWIELDLGRVREVERLVLFVDQSPAGLTTHVVSVGLDEGAMTQLVELRGETDWGDELVVEGPFVTRYIRVETVESASWVAWLEIEVEVAG